MSQSATISLSVDRARVVTGLLTLLAELPSTPKIVAEGAQHHGAAIERHLPTPYHPQPWDERRVPASTVELDADTATAVVELLELFEEIPSTPPPIAEDARDQAAAMRRSLEEAD